MGKVLAFGIAKEITGGPVVAVDLRGMTVAGLKEKLAMMWPRLGQLKSFMIAVNGEYADPERVIQDSDEVAIIPPVSGG